MIRWHFGLVVTLLPSNQVTLHRTMTVTTDDDPKLSVKALCFFFCLSANSFAQTDIVTMICHEWLDETCR